MGFFVKKEFVKDSILKKTVEVWQPLTKEKLTEEDAREIIDNITGFFSVLKKWDDEERRKKEDVRI
jgi:hypothetical protein